MSTKKLGSLFLKLQPYHDINLSFSHFAMTPESKLRLNFDSPIGCIIVIIGGKYLNRIGNIMEKVNSVTNNIGGRRLLAVFLMSTNYKENMTICRCGLQF